MERGSGKNESRGFERGGGRGSVEQRWDRLKGKHKWWNGKEAKLNFWLREVIRFYFHSALSNALIIIYIYMQLAFRLADFDRAWGWNRFKGGRQPCLVNSVWLTVERRRWLTGLEAWKISFPSTSDAVVGIERPSSERKKYPVKSVETFFGISTWGNRISRISNVSTNLLVTHHSHSIVAKYNI